MARQVTIHKHKWTLSREWGLPGPLTTTACGIFVDKPRTRKLWRWVTCENCFRTIPWNTTVMHRYKRPSEIVSEFPSVNTACGISVYILDSRQSWKHTTCKNCLRTRWKEQEAK